MHDVAIIFSLVALRIAGMIVFAPLLGGRVLPIRLKLMLAAVLAVGMIGALPGQIEIPQDQWQLALGMAGELLVGALFGMAISLVFTAAQMAGDLAGRQMGFDLAGAFDPACGTGANPVSDLYYILAAFVFLLVGGDHALVLGIGSSLQHLPPLAFALDGGALDVLVGVLAGAFALTLRLAIPVFAAVLVVDIALAMLGRTIPQLGFMSIAVTIRMVAGLTVVLLGLGTAAAVLTGALQEAFILSERLWTGQ